MPDFLKDKNSLSNANARKLRHTTDGAISENSKFYIADKILRPQTERVSPSISSAKNLKLELHSNYENRTVLSGPGVDNSHSKLNPNSNVNNLRIYSPTKLSEEHLKNKPPTSPTKSTDKLCKGNTVENNTNVNMPPPLPPKPKILPIRPSNWGQNLHTKSSLYLEHPTSSFV